MKASEKMDPRTAALQLAANRKAEMTNELTIELHLAAFTVAITMVLGSQATTLRRNIFLVYFGLVHGI